MNNTKVPSRNVHDSEKVDNKTSIHIGIPTPYMKHFPVIPLDTEQTYIKINPPLSSGGYLITEDRKMHRKKSHTNM